MVQHNCVTRLAQRCHFRCKSRHDAATLLEQTPADAGTHTLPLTRIRARVKNNSRRYLSGTATGHRRSARRSRDNNFNTPPLQSYVKAIIPHFCNVRKNEQLQLCSYAAATRSGAQPINQTRVWSPERFRQRERERERSCRAGVQDSRSRQNGCQRKIAFGGLPAHTNDPS